MVTSVPGRLTMLFQRMLVRELSVAGNAEGHGGPKEKTIAWEESKVLEYIPQGESLNSASQVSNLGNVEEEVG